jgi:hypothetical protein
MLGSWQVSIVVGIVVVFSTFLLWKYWPSRAIAEPLVRSYGWRHRHSAPVDAKIREALDRARHAATPVNAPSF